MALDPALLEECWRNVRRRLLDARVDGHWEGELSSSALSTATAVFALALYSREQPASSGVAPRCGRLVDAGVEWLIHHQNPDGGWGDTLLSHSNISTTALCWAALSAGDERAAGAAAAAEAWLRSAAGSTEPGILAEAIARRYGKDRTFSVPILTMCALAGRLGEGPECWRHVPALPFELAAFPRGLFPALRLPVVSYALPALIAMGQVSHRRRPPRNPAIRLARDAARARTLRVLEEIQPPGGGFLEATPLTSFVTMSLIAAGQAEHPVTRKGVDFLIRSARPDGSWPIDTNLATWLTTLSVNALSAGSSAGDEMPCAEREAIADWLLKQQYRQVHPYTRAPPGGWAWTDLPGGVPDADDTAGALLALRNLGVDSPAVREAAAAGVRWLVDLQNRDGGIPTFCKGWGALPFDRSGADLTAHALLAWAAWREQLPGDLRERAARATEEASSYLIRAQRSDGAWAPLWFGSQDAPGEENLTYGTARVLPALLALEREAHPELEPATGRAAAWLLSAQNQDGGWGGDRDVASSIEETGLAIHALAPLSDRHAGAGEAVARGAAWLLDGTDCGRSFPPSPIGFYFAKLWYFERDYPLIFAAAGLASVRSSV